MTSRARRRRRASAAGRSSSSAWRAAAAWPASRRRPYHRVPATATSWYGMWASRSTLRKSRSSALQQLRHGALDVHLVDQQHAAAQVEAEAHRLEAESSATSQGAREAVVSGDRVLALEASLDQVARLELVVDAVEADATGGRRRRRRRPRRGIAASCKRVADWPASARRRTRRGRAATAAAPATRRTRSAGPAGSPRPDGRKQDALPEGITLHARGTREALRRP